MLFLTALILVSTPSDAGTTGDPSLKAMEPLLGHWVAEPDSKTPGATGWSSFTLELGGRVIVRKNHAQYPAQEHRPASVHDDLMVIALEHGQPRAAYFDNEGHVIHYSIESTAGRWVFLSDRAAGEPRFRRSYVLTSN